ncbi:MAG: thiolase [Actinobacteria bacterium]|nr:thiolase [Actinomycetota bacterium]
MQDVFIVGAAECDLGVTTKSILELQSQAVTRALADAGLTTQDVDGIATNGISRFSATQLADYLGIVPSFTDSSFAGGSSFEIYVARAVEALRSGQCSTVVISFASNQRSAKSRSLGGVVEHHTPEAQFETPYGPLFPLSYYAMAAQRYLHEVPTGRAALSEVAISAREWALLNPVAFRYGTKSLTPADIEDADLISSPLTTADCCLVTDGGGAIVLTTKLVDKKRGVKIIGYGEATTNTSMTSVDDLMVTGAVESGKRAFAMAGITPQDIDVVEVYDSFTITVLLTLEALGFASRGGAADLLLSGKTRPGGSFPLNTSGGGLSYCHPGQYGILLLVEAVRQLRGECGERQVPHARRALAHGTGGIISTHATVILEKVS